MIYLRLAALAAFLALAAVALWYRGEAIDAEAARDREIALRKVVVEANRSLAEANDRLVRQSAINDRVLLGLSDQLAGIHAGLVANTAAVQDLEKSNEEVRAYLGTVVPDALELQLNR